MIKRVSVYLVVLSFLFAGVSFADDGMWLFNAFPKDKVKAAYGFEPSQGSPVINKNTEGVGIIFDGNVGSLPWNFMYDDVVRRSVATDSRAIIEVLRKVYHANGLADELTEPTATSGKSKATKPATPQK
jgi:Peptidase S46